MAERCARNVLVDQVEYMEIRKVNMPKYMIDVEEAITYAKTQLNAVDDNSFNVEYLQSKSQKLEQQVQPYNRFRAFQLKPKKQSTHA